MHTRTKSVPSRLATLSTYDKASSKQAHASQWKPREAAGIVDIDIVIVSRPESCVLKKALSMYELFEEVRLERQSGTARWFAGKLGGGNESLLSYEDLSWRFPS